jgi:hypothetical protein
MNMTNDEREKQSLMLKIVQKMDIMMTSPEEEIVKQEANPVDMPPNFKVDEDLGDNDTKEPEPHMYFIATGKCYVEV